MSKQITIKVTAPSGVWIPGFGARQCGGEYTLAADHAEALLRMHPAKFERVRPPEKSKPKPDGDQREDNTDE